MRIENLDTDQIMPKQFLRGIDKAGWREACCTTCASMPRGQAAARFRAEPRGLARMPASWSAARITAAAPAASMRSGVCSSSAYVLS